MSEATGVALSIRNATESETFDLAGQNVSTITNTIQSAFATPLPLKDMIRITFITGAGKQARQKYDEGAARAVTSTLRDLGYEDDRAASCVVECAGSFKLQHDTGKNLKTVVVFPKIIGNEEGANAENGALTPSLVPEGCPAHKIAMSSMNTFERMVGSQCPSWSQKKGCVAALEHLKSMVDDLDGKLIKGTPLDDAEQGFYDGVTALDEKLAFTKEEMHKQVENGDITKFEKDILLEQNAERLETIADELEAAKGQTLEKLRVMKNKMTERKQLLQDIDPKPPHKLRHEQAIAKLWKEAVPLLQMEEKARGRLLSVKETQSVARKDEIMAEIEELEEASRGWFEDVDAFEARLKAIRLNFTAKLNQKSKASGNSSKKTPTSYASATAGNSGNATKWVTPGQAQTKGVSATKKKKKNLGSGVFAAMMADDSDSDDEGDDKEYADNDTEENSKLQQTKVNTPGTSLNSNDHNQNNASNNNNNNSNNSKKKKKSKKGGNKIKKEADMTEDELLASSAAANASQNQQEADGQVSHPAIEFVKLIFSILLSILTWILSLFMGSSKKGGKQKKR